MDYEKRLNELFVGKKVTVNLSEYAEENLGLEWDPDWSEDEEGEETELASGNGHLEIEYRSYRSSHYDDDDDDEEDYDDEDEDDGDDEDDNYYDESSNWHITTGMDFVVDDEGAIESITITAEVSSFGDSGLGDCDPEYEWINDDFESAVDFLKRITE